MIEKKTRIIYEYNSLVDFEKLKLGKVETNEKYLKLFSEIEKPFEKFKLQYPNILVVYFFSPVNNEFSIYDIEVHDHKEESICQNFLEFLNSEANLYLK